MNSITITGVDGFVGTHLARLAHAQGYSVIGISRSAEISTSLAGLLTEYISTDLSVEFPDISVGRAVIHLAGLAAVGPSFSSPQRYIEVNSSMVTHMCEALLSHEQNRQARVIAVSSGAVYAPPAADDVISEDSQLFMSSPYVVSKILIENLVTYYAARGLKTVIARPFNHIGPGQGPGFLVPDLWAKLTKTSENGTIKVGNLSTERDYLDVRDVARAYLSLTEAKITPGETFNICSGVSRSGLSILDELCRIAGISVPELVVDGSLLRPQDAMRIVGSPQKLKRVTGWEPQYALHQSLQDFVESARLLSG